MSAAPAPAKNLADGLAIAMSLACLIHCLALPLIVALAPAWARWLDLPEALHLWLLLAVAPFSLFVLWRASRGVAPGRRLPLALAMSGLAIMAVGLALEGKPFEALVTGVGAVLVAAAHVQNWRRRNHVHQ